MATAIDNYVFDMKTRGIEDLKRAKQELKEIGDAAQNTGERLRNMGLLASAGLAAMFANVMKLTDELSDLSDATGINMGKLRGLSLALEEAGGNADDTGKMMNKFLISIDDAAQGSDKARKAFAEVGVTLSDLRNLSEEQLFDKVINRLSQMEAGAKRTALGVELFGKSFGYVDPKMLNTALATKNFDELKKVMEENKKVAELLKQTFLAFQQALMNVIASSIPLLEKLVGPIDQAGISIQQAEKLIKMFGIALAVAVSAKILIAMADLIKLTIAFGQAMKAAALWSAAAALTNPGMLAAGLVAGAAAAGGAWALFGDKIKEVFKDVDDYINGVNKAALPGSGSGSSGGGGRNVVGETEKQRAEREKLEAAEKARLERIRQITSAFADQNNQILQNLGVESEVIGKTEKQAEVMKAVEEIRQRAADTSSKLRAEQEKLDKSDTVRRQGIENEIILIQQKADADAAATQRSIENNQRLRENTQTTNQLKELQIQHSNTMLKLDQDRVMVMTKFTGMTAAQEKFARTELEIKDRLLLKLKEINDEYKKNVASGMTPENAGKIRSTKTDQANAEAESQIETARRVAAEQTRIDNSYLEGFSAKMQQMSQTFTPFQMATDATTMAFGQINSAIDSLVENGKASFSDLARSIIKNLTKMILQQMAFNAVAGIMKGFGGGVGPSAGDFFGGADFPIGKRATGGSVSGNKPYMVGEKGPELFIPGGNGTVIPNRNLGGEDKPAVTNVQTINVSAIDGQSVAKFFFENKQLVMMSNMAAQKERR